MTLSMRRSVVVVATSDKPALERNKAAKTATAIAEYFLTEQEEDLIYFIESQCFLSLFQFSYESESYAVPVAIQILFHLILLAADVEDYFLCIS